MLGQRPGSVQPGYGQADKTFCLSIAHNTLIIYIVLTSMQHKVVTRKSPQSNKKQRQPTPACNHRSHHS